MNSSHRLINLLETWLDGYDNPSYTPDQRRALELINYNVSPKITRLHNLMQSPKHRLKYSEVEYPDLFVAGADNSDKFHNKPLTSQGQAKLDDLVDQSYHPVGSLRLAYNHLLSKGASK